jgi:hypothetical protein
MYLNYLDQPLEFKEIDVVKRMALFLTSLMMFAILCYLN